MPWWVWGLLGLLALAGESISMALFLLNVAIAAFVAAILAFFGTPVAAQVGAFVILSALLVMLVRPRMVQALMGRTAQGLTGQNALVGRTATVTEPVTLDGGMIRVGQAEFWTARANTPIEAIAAGSRVRIARIDGLTAYVDPLPAALEEPLRPGPAAAGETIEGGMPAGAAPSPPFGELLKRHRLAANLTQEALAERAGLSVRAISDLERGLHRSPQRETVHLLADALDLSPQHRAAFEAAARRLNDASTRLGH